MNKKCIPHSHATLCVLLCLATLLCFTSCFNLNSNQRGNFSFTINEAVAQQLENALGPRSARSTGAPVITATVTLTRTAGGELTTPVAKSGTIASLINETFTFEDLPLHVPFTVSVSFKANGKEIFSGTSEPITLTSADATPVAIALYHMLDTDIVLPYYYYDEEDDSESYVSFRYSNMNQIPVDPYADMSDFCGGSSFCFDAYGNTWSILESCGLLFKGSEAVSQEYLSDMELMISSGFLRMIILTPVFITCDYSTNELYICCVESENNNDIPLLRVYKVSVDELLSHDPTQEVMIRSSDEESFTQFLNSKNLDFDLIPVTPVHGEDTYLEKMLGYSWPENNRIEDSYAFITSFAANNGTLYVGYSEKDEDEYIIDTYIASVNPVTGVVSKTKLEATRLFGSGASVEDISINDMLYLDGKLYALVSYKSTTGALVRIDPKTLTFGSGDVLGVCKDFAQMQKGEVPETSGYWVYMKDGKKCQLADSEKSCFENANGFYKLPKGNSFAGPVKFSAIKPKKLVVADCGFYYTDGDVPSNPTNRILTIDLNTFSIEDSKNIGFTLVDPSDLSVAEIYMPTFSATDVKFYNAAGYGSTESWEDISFTEEEFATLLNNGDIFYYIHN